MQPLHKFIRIVRTIHRTRLKGFIFRLGLRIKVVAVNHKHHFIHIVQFGYKLCCLKRGQGLSGSSGMPYIAVVIGVRHLIQYLFYGIELIRAKHHQALVALMQHDVFADDFSERTFFKEENCKLIQFIERHIGGIRPVERKLVAAVRIVGEIASVYSIGNNE